MVRAAAGRVAGVLRGSQDLSHLVELAGHGDRQAKEIFARAAQRLARAVAATVAALDPEVILVAGEGTASWPHWDAPFRSTLARYLAAHPATVTIAVPAADPFFALRLTGVTQPTQSARVPLRAYPVELRSVEFTGGVPAPVAVAHYEAAAPDPFWREAPAVLRHLEHCHTADLVSCVRAHGLPGLRDLTADHRCTDHPGERNQ